MWPFKKKQPQQEVARDITVDGVTASYCDGAEEWEFSVGDHVFTFTQRELDPAVFGWAHDALESIEPLKDAMRQSVADCLGEWTEQGDPEAADIVSIDLTEYGAGQRAVVSFAGDASWGDFGVDVVVEGDKIQDIDAGD